MRKTINKNKVFKLLAFLISFLIYFLILDLFTKNLYLKLSLALVSALFSYKVLIYIFKIIKQKRYEGYYLEFLEFLSNELSLNISLSRAIYNALNKIKSNSKNKRLNKNLELVLKSIDLKAPFSEVSRLLLESFPIKAAKSTLSLLAQPQILGENLRRLINTALKTQAQALEEKTRIINNNIQKLVETLSLILMPLLILVFLNIFAAKFINLAYENLAGKLILLAAYFCFFLAIVFAIKIFIPSRYKEKEAKSLKIKKKKIKNSRLISKLFKILVFKQLENKLNKAFKFLARQENLSLDDLKLYFIRQKLRFIAYGLIIAAVFIYQDLYLLAFIMFVLLSLYPELNFIDIYKERLKLIKLDLATFLNNMLLLISSSYNIEYALNFNANLDIYNPYLEKEIHLINSKLKNQVPLKQALNDFSEKLDDYNLSIFFDLLEDYENLDSSESFGILELQLKNISTAEYKRLNKYYASKTNAYLIPMILDLISVLAICLAPVISSLKTYKFY